MMKKREILPDLRRGEPYMKERGRKKGFVMERSRGRKRL